MNTAYSGSFGRLKVHYNDFLGNEFIKSLLDLEIKDIKLRLYETSYKDDIDKSSVINSSELDILIAAINRHIINNSRIAIFAVPPEIKNYIKTYISKWDIESIKAILISKIIKHEIKYNDSFIISFRDIPLGIFAGNLSYEDFRSMLSRPDVESLVNYLVSYGYNYLLQYIDEFKKTGDIYPLLSSLDSHYYNELADQAKFFNGDEGILINYTKEYIDIKNILTVIKGIELKVSYDSIERYLIDNGNLTKNILSDLFRSNNTVDVLKVFKDYDLEDAIEYYQKYGSLSMFEISMRKALLEKYLPLMMRTTGAPFILGYILTAERERDNLRTILIGKSYNLDRKLIERMLM
ncbi:MULTISPECIES: V-type ATPase subunit [Acidiplasma]|uniref:ATP synthase subunit C n=2 Tax=Acidiplasma TaxID=507753 RepID=A0A0Q0RU77_9ARCH|nr:MULTISPECIES: V-type ATPase subunit [Acidiplasma]KJE48965.1 ATP synthase subunit C [Acidiplasma sp. MBA-1]KQB34450.1 ATP synthase subunit C [Acidiplasma aeolicum]KQB35887.1 ATP synthase subunit C [Acidiplasma cupricumulans]WMT54387.1 MAG: V-type ATPase subunit [Acidiplasma sp.]